MKKYFFFAALLLQGLCSRAQVYTMTAVHTGDELTTYFTYRFPTFTDATVLFKNGGLLVSKMNFNTFLCVMQFINAKGDTLELLKAEDIDSIRLNSSVFFYNKGFYEIAAKSDSARLVVYRKVSYLPVKIGAMGTAVNGASVDVYNSFISHAGNKELVLSEDINVKRETLYYLTDDNGQMMNATKSNFLKIFSNNKKGIQEFLKSNRINFNHLDDLEKLFHFCTSTAK